MLDRPAVQRVAAPFPSRARSATRRRVVVGVLVVLSLALLSIYFRESGDGPLHDGQGVGATALRPFEVGAERVARPFRDLYGWFDGLLSAKSENEKLRKQLAEARADAIENQTAAQENAELREQLLYQDLPGLEDFRSVNTRVLTYPSQQFERTVVIAAGSTAGIRPQAPVLARGTLVGVVTGVTARTAKVTLLTDESSAVSAYDVNSGATGLVQSAEGGSLSLERVPKAKDVHPDDVIATAGSREGPLPSLFPRGIPIGVVTSAANTDTEPFKQIQLAASVDFSNLYAVTVLVR
ncbi:MAG TPA: rod shape-determining protein MreC [Gaiellaceae bacterium]|nr:rod shape-determining protein MreC [Gaiellaceae bacterium]